LDFVLGYDSRKMRAVAPASLVPDLDLSGPRVGNGVHFSSFPLLIKLSCRAFGNSLKVPSEVNVQGFFCRGWDHFLASDEEITAILRAFPSSNPSPERIDERCLRESLLVDKHSGLRQLHHSSWVTGGAISVVCSRARSSPVPDLCGTRSVTSRWRQTKSRLRPGQRSSS
jgi:hypothetical protein